LKVLVLVQVGLLACATVAWSVAVHHLGGDLTAAVSAFSSAALLETTDSLVFLAATIVFLTWVYRAIANLPALGSMSCAFTPSGAVWGFFIPFVNLVRGHQVMTTIWQESQPPAVNENGFYLPRKSTLVSWWWGLYLAAGVLGVIVSSGVRVSIEELRAAGSMQVALHLVRIVTAFLFLFMVHRAQERQDEQWQDLVRQRDVPKPSAEALR
jgi:hypothetical protein